MGLWLYVVLYLFEFFGGCVLYWVLCLVFVLFVSGLFKWYEVE